MKKILLALGLLAAMAGAAWAQTSGTNTVSRNGYYFNATTGQRTNADGSAYIADDARDRDSYLTPTLVYADTMASTAGGDTLTLGNLAAYRQVYLIFQTSFDKNPGGWNKYACNVRLNMNGESDSLSLVTLPVRMVGVGDSTFFGSAASAYWPLYATGTTALVAGRGESVVTLTTTGKAGLAGTKSLPQSQAFLMELPGGNPAWPAGVVTVRLRRIAQAIANSTTTADNPRPPLLRVYVLATPL